MAPGSEPYHADAAISSLVHPSGGVPYRSYEEPVQFLVPLPTSMAAGPEASAANGEADGGGAVLGFLGGLGALARAGKLLGGEAQAPQHRFRRV